MRRRSASSVAGGGLSMSCVCALEKKSCHSALPLAAPSGVRAFARACRASCYCSALAAGRSALPSTNSRPNAQTQRVGERIARDAEADVGPTNV